MSDRTLTEKQTKLLKLADYIEGQPDRLFDMSVVREHRECGTVCCIAGFSKYCFEIPDDEDESDGRFLDLSIAESDALFMPPGYKTPKLYTKSQAVSTLRHFAMTGEIDWSVGK